MNATMKKTKKKKSKKNEISAEILNEFEKGAQEILVSPDDLIVDKELRGRKILPSKDYIASLATSMVEKGQQQSITCRPVPDQKNPLEQKLAVVFGFTRVEAAKLIRKGFTTPDGKKTIHKPDFMLAALVKDVSEEEAVLLNIVENAIRAEISPIDAAFKQQELRDKYGMTDAAITRLYGYKQQSSVTQLKKLLDLEEEFHPLVHEGVISQTAAIELMKLDYETRKAAIDNLLELMKNLGKTKLTNPEVNEEIKSQKEKNGDEELSSDEVRPKTVKEIREFFEDMANSTDKTEAKFADSMIKFIKNELSDDNFNKQLRKYLAK